MPLWSPISIFTSPATPHDDPSLPDCWGAAAEAANSVPGTIIPAITRIARKTSRIKQAELSWQRENCVVTGMVHPLSSNSILSWDQGEPGIVPVQGRMDSFKPNCNPDFTLTSPDGSIIRRTA
jgi:hypothetical protein